MRYVLHRGDTGTGANGNGKLRWARQGGEPAAATAVESVARNGNGAYAPGLRSAMERLDDLVGLGRVKELIRETMAHHCIQDRRAQMGLRANHTVLHMVFKGNPGTGKTTVARLLGAVFREMGALKSGHLVEVERADLVGEYIGQTAQKTREKVRQARGGILFVDEAYSLARGGEKDFGREAVDLLVKAMEDLKDDLVLILAGYRSEMDRFLNINPGLKSRFPLHLSFPDYSAEELEIICRQMLDQRQYRLTGPAADYLASRMRSMAETRGPGKPVVEGNGRFVRNLVESTIRRHSLRLLGEPAPTRDDYMNIMRRDIEQGFKYCLSEGGFG